VIFALYRRAIEYNKYARSVHDIVNGNAITRTDISRGSRLLLVVRNYSDRENAAPREKNIKLETTIALFSTFTTDIYTRLSSSTLFEISGK